MKPQDFPDFSAGELARNELWNHSIPAVLTSVVGRTIRLGIAGWGTLEWFIVEVAPEWFRATAHGDVEFVAQTARVDWLEVDVRSPSEPPDSVAPRFRGVLAEIGRRRSLVRLMLDSSDFTGRVHHVGADYLELTRETGEPIVIALCSIGWVEFLPD
ncbi:MAG TPA: hypothetical protein VK139_00645 [Microbacteriaceae bacterium]|nr:hypothetical protein [Microbacteriaceae bacterium]